MRRVLFLAVTLVAACSVLFAACGGGDSGGDGGMRSRRIRSSGDHARMMEAAQGPALIQDFHEASHQADAILWHTQGKLTGRGK